MRQLFIEAFAQLVSNLKMKFYFLQSVIFSACASMVLSMFQMEPFTLASDISDGVC